LPGKHVTVAEALTLSELPAHVLRLIVYCKSRRITNFFSGITLLLEIAATNPDAWVLCQLDALLCNVMVLPGSHDSRTTKQSAAARINARTAAKFIYAGIARRTPILALREISFT
jgi:hypothetical protein